jgi:hypothetical protein
MGPDTQIYGAPLKITADQFNQIRDKKIAMLIWGWADYDDIFPNSKRHRTEFCLHISITTQPDGSVSIQLPLYSRFNGADEECVQEPLPYNPANWPLA